MKDTNLVKNKMDGMQGTKITAVLIYPRKYLIMGPENNIKLLNVLLRRESFLIKLINLAREGIRPFFLLSFLLSEIFGLGRRSHRC